MRADGTTLGENGAEFYMNIGFHYLTPLPISGHPTECYINMESMVGTDYVIDHPDRSDLRRDNLLFDKMKFSLMTGKKYAEGEIIAETDELREIKFNLDDSK